MNALPMRVFAPSQTAMRPLCTVAGTAPMLKQALAECLANGLQAPALKPRR
jgi:hypothetical protein